MIVGVQRRGMLPTGADSGRAGSPVVSLQRLGPSLDPHGGSSGRREAKMTGIAQSATVAEHLELGEVNGSAKLTRQTEPPRGAVGRWPGLGWLTCGVVGTVAIVWFIFGSPGESGSKAEWFFGAVVFGAVLVAMWQTANIQRQAVDIQRQATQNAAEAAERLRKELVAAEERSARALELTRTSHQAEMDARQTLHRAEMDARQTLHRAEMDAQSELARMERSHLLKRLQKQAMIEVSRAVSAHTQMLATLWNEAARVLRVEDRDERQWAMNPIFEQISQVVNDFSVELGNAHLLIEDNRLHHALDRVNEAAVMAVRVAEDIHVAVIDGHTPQPNPIRSVQRLMYERAAEARRLAWDLLRTGLDDSIEAAQLARSDSAG
jgi:hypothetical protein